jgi:hypothetical protein
MKLEDLILVQTSHSPVTIDTETLGLSSPVFFEKTGTQSKKCENFCESVGIKI